MGLSRRADETEARATRVAANWDPNLDFSEWERKEVQRGGKNATRGEDTAVPLAPGQSTTEEAIKRRIEGNDQSGESERTKTSVQVRNEKQQAIQKGAQKEGNETPGGDRLLRLLSRGKTIAKTSAAD